MVQMIRLLAEQGEIISETSLRTYLNRHFCKEVNSTIRLETVAGQSAIPVETVSPYITRADQAVANIVS